MSRSAPHRNEAGSGRVRTACLRSKVTTVRACRESDQKLSSFADSDGFGACHLQTQSGRHTRMRDFATHKWLPEFGVASGIFLARQESPTLAKTNSWYTQGPCCGRLLRIINEPQAPSDLDKQQSSLQGQDKVRRLAEVSIWSSEIQQWRQKQADRHDDSSTTSLRP